MIVFVARYAFEHFLSAGLVVDKIKYKIKTYLNILRFVNHDVDLPLVLPPLLAAAASL